MVLIGRTDKGRIFVKEFEIEKIVYLFVKEFYPQFKCYAVDYTDSILNLYIHNKALPYSVIEQFQNEIQTYFQDKMGIYFKLINVNVR